jgi:hypothetical protein
MGFYDFFLTGVCYNGRILLGIMIFGSEEFYQQY